MAHSVCQLSIYNSFPVIRTTIAKKLSFYVPRPSFFVCSGDAPRQSRKTLHEWKGKSVLAKPLAACRPTNLSSTVSELFEPQLRKCKKSPFSRTAAHIFVSPGDAPATITQYVSWMERQFNACQNPRSMYPSTSKSFRVIRCLIQCVTPKIGIFTTFLFPLGTPLAQSCTLNVVWMEREFDAYKLPRCMCPSNRFWDTARYSWKNRKFFIPPCIRCPR